ncbi:divalent cation tolerance protein, partial [Trypanosoma grayi]|uniref:divalent cation tolerance protein n=1 Tax=Trypanosoma grayi TaxID=71804 RepID=UPI0004F47B44
MVLMPCRFLFMPFLLKLCVLPLRAVVVLCNMFSVCYVTTPSMEVARDLSRRLVLSKKVACVNIIPAVTSVFQWEGRVCEETECLMMVKTQTALVEEVIADVVQ